VYFVYVLRYLVGSLWGLILRPCGPSPLNKKLQLPHESVYLDLISSTCSGAKLRCNRVIARSMRVFFPSAIYLNLCSSKVTLAQYVSARILLSGMYA